MKWFKQLLSVLLIGCLMACTFPFASTAARTPQEQKPNFKATSTKFSAVSVKPGKKPKPTVNL